VGQRIGFVVNCHPPLASSNDLVVLSSLRGGTTKQSNDNQLNIKHADYSDIHNFVCHTISL
jgi:hypothetical protein